MSENKNKEKKKKGGILNRIMGGEIFTSKIITNNVWLLALIVLYSFIYVSNRYEYEQELLRIDRLTKKRDKLKNNLLTLKSEFSYKSRQTEIEKFLQETNSDLKVATKPIYKVRKEE
jgi:cell division protein FtsL